MAKLIDPDDLNEGTEIVLDVSNPASPTIQLLVAGNLSNDGVTLQCVFSKLKELWKEDDDYPKYPFPMESITDEQFELQNGWTWEDSTTVGLLRDAGFAVKNAAGTILERWMNITTLGTFQAPSTDRAYYQQVSGANPVDAGIPGPVNQAIQIYGGPSNGNFDRRDFFRMFLREEGKVFAYYDLIASQNISQLTYKKYSLPLTNRLDVKVEESDANIAANAPYTGITLTYLAGVGFAAWANATVYAANAVVSDGGRWYITVAGGTSSGTGVADDTGVTWVSYTGERQIGASWYAFNKIIDGNDASAEEIYEKVQYLLRQTGDIDSGSGTVRGDTADELLEFIGDTLRTKTGVYIDDFDATDTNRLQFTDVGDVVRTFPFVAAGKLIFDGNLRGDSDAEYHMYFEDANGNEWGTDDAILVEDADGNPIEGDVNGEAEISFTFDYDGNDQGGRTPATPAAVVVVVIGLESAQYNALRFTIERSVSNNFNVGAALERNYANPA